MPNPSKQTKQQLPILARHAVSLCLAFTIGLVLSYFVGQYIHQQIQLGKLNNPDQTTFERGVGYVLTHAATDEGVYAHALDAVTKLDAQRAADLLLAIAQSHAERDAPTEPLIPTAVIAEIAPLMQRLTSMQAIGLYDGLIQIKGTDPISAADSLLNSLKPKDDAELLAVVDLLDTRLIWSKQWAPLDLWVRWLGVLADSESELTQAQTAKRLGELPKAVDDGRVTTALKTLSASKYETVRNIVLHEVAGYAAIAKDPTDYEQIIFTLGKDKNKHIARRAWMIVGHLKPSSGFAVNWQDADPFVAEAMLWSAAKTNPESDRVALQALRTKGYEAAGALALNEWHRPSIPVSDADLIFQQLIRSQDKRELKVALRCILASKDYMNAEAGIIEPYGYEPIEDPQLAPLHFAGNWVAAALTPEYDPTRPFSASELTAHLEGIFEHGGNGSAARDLLAPGENWPLYARLLSAAHQIDGIDLDPLVGGIPLDQPVLLDLFTLALTHAEDEVLDRFIRSSHPQMVTMAAIAAVMRGYQPRLIEGANAAFIRKHPDLTSEQIRAMTDVELADLGLSRIDALPALAEAAEAAPASANRLTEAKLLKLALWMRGDLDDGFTPTAEGLLFDDEVPTSTVLMCLLQKQRPAALDYLFGDLATQRPDLSKLFIQERYWHVFRQFVDTADLKLWLWGDHEAQAFQLEAMKQWYAVNRWKIKEGWWPEAK